MPKASQSVYWSSESPVREGCPHTVNPPKAHEHVTETPENYQPRLPSAVRESTGVHHGVRWRHGSGRLFGISFLRLISRRGCGCLRLRVGWTPSLRSMGFLLDGILLALQFQLWAWTWWEVPGVVVRSVGVRWPTVRLGCGHGVSKCANWLFTEKLWWQLSVIDIA